MQLAAGTWQIVLGGQVDFRNNFPKSGYKIVSTYVICLAIVYLSIVYLILIDNPDSPLWLGERVRLNFKGKDK